MAIKSPAQQRRIATEKNIAQFLETLPLETLLALTETEEQIQHWLLHRNFQIWVSQCWSALHEGKDDPLHIQLQSGDIDAMTYNRVWLTVDYYEKLWELIQISFCYVKAEFERLELASQPKSALELFLEIVKRRANAAFSVCLGYNEVSAPKFVKECQLISRGYKGEVSPLKCKQLHKKQKQEDAKGIKNLMNFTLAICHRKATKSRPALKAKLEAFYTAMLRFNDNEATVRRKVGSFAWKNGRILRTRKEGGIYIDA